MASVSADGRFVVFNSRATNLVAGDTNNAGDVFIRDRRLGTTERLTVSSAEEQANQGSTSIPWISPDGRFVTFNSAATNLVANDTNNQYDIFLRDRQLGTTERINLSSSEAQATGQTAYGDIAPTGADGRYVAFISRSSNLVPGDFNGQYDVFVRDRQAGTTERISVDSLEMQANGENREPRIAPDGRYVAFWSSASNLVEGDTNGKPDVFVRDRQLGTTERVSVSTAEEQAINGSSFLGSISADGRWVAFSSSASNLEVNDTNSLFDVFLRDRQEGRTFRISITTDGVQSDGHGPTAMSPDGRFVAFRSLADNLVPKDTNGGTDIFVRNRQAGTTDRVNLSSTGLQANASAEIYAGAVSADGRVVAFDSYASNLVPSDLNITRDVFVRDRGVREHLITGDFDGNGRSDLANIRSDGLWVLMGGATAWTRLHTTYAGGFTVGDLDASGREELIVDFDAGGLWARYNNATWTRLHPKDVEWSSLVAGDFDSNPRDDLGMDFGAAGVWTRYNNATWSTLGTTLGPEGFAVGDTDGNGRSELIADLGPKGIFAFNSGLWARLHIWNPEDLESGDLDGDNKDEIVADVGSYGLIVWSATSPGFGWTQLHATSPETLALGDFDGGGKDDLAVDFGAGGLWVRYNNATWTRIHTANAEGMTTGDFDANGKAELIVDFGNGGLYARYNNANWTRLPALP